MSEAKYANELEILRKELALHIASHWFAPAGSLEDIYYALSPPIHEGHSPSFGAIFMPCEAFPPMSSDPSLANIELAVPTSFSAPVPSREIELRTDQIQHARLLADGRTAFIVRTPTSTRLVFFSEDVGAEFALSSLVIKTGGAVVQRDRSGLVRLFTHSAIHYHKERRWKSTLSMEGGITPLLIEPPPFHWQELLSSILHFAYYHLSTSGVGATLIWCIHDRVFDKHKQDITGEKDFRWAHLNLMRREDMPALAHLLAQKDLATLIDSEGNVVAVGVHLKSQQEAPPFLQKHSGSRHTSARHYSFEEPEAVVVTVSADGPVSVFSDGILTQELIQYGRPVGGAPEAILTSEQRSGPWLPDEVKCANCKKQLLVHRLNVDGYRIKQTVLCPVCKKPLPEMECTKLQARVIKHIPPT